MQRSSKKSSVNETRKMRSRTLEVGSRKSDSPAIGGSGALIVWFAEVLKKFCRYFGRARLSTMFGRQERPVLDLPSRTPPNRAGLVTIPNSLARQRTRRDFLALAGKGLGLAALSSATVASLLKNVEAATKSVAKLTPEEAAMDEDYWAVIQNAFTVTRGIINLNNGGVSPSPRKIGRAHV